jgi:Trypsin-like peptidase domain
VMTNVFAVFRYLILLAPLVALAAPTKLSAQEWGTYPPAVAGQVVSQARVPDWIVAASVKVSVCLDQQRCWSGSGTIFHVDARRGLAFVLTNHHVAPRDGAKITVTFPRGETRAATFVCTETDPDISIVAVAGDAATPFVPLAEASPPAGTPVYQVGYPHGQGPACRAGACQGQGGIVAGKFRNLNFQLNTTNGDSGSGIFRQSDGRLCAVLWGGIGPTNTSAVPVEYVHKMIREVDQKYSVIVGVGIIRDRPPQPAQPQQPAAPWQPQQPGGGPVVTPIAPTQPAPTQPDPVLTGILQTVAAHEKAIGDLAGQVQTVNKTAADALAKAGVAHGQLPQLTSVVNDLQGKLPALAGVVSDVQQKFPQLAGVVSDVQNKLPALAGVLSDVNSKVPAIAAKVEALGAAAGGSSALPLIGAIGGPVGAALGLAAMLLASLAKKGGTSAVPPITFHLPAGFVASQPAAAQQQQQAA